jgi:18S rRNA (guanine1575-N7)-methyltransferase
MSRPEHLMPAECFYNEQEAKKYTNCTRIIHIQSEMAERCLELINIPFNREKVEEPDDDFDEEDIDSSSEESEEEPEQLDNNSGLEEEADGGDHELTPLVGAPLFILDIGCGSGLSGELITKYGHMWWGLDISENMLTVARDREVEGELMLGDIGEGFNFLPGFFDAVISVSALQWLCNADKKIHDPWKRLLKFFESLHKCLKLGGKAAIQFYPENEEQLEMISNAAIKSGFAGGLYVDFPNSASARKYYLILSTAVEGKLGIVRREGKNEVEDDGKCQKLSRRIKKEGKIKKGKFDYKSKFWIYHKKERQRKQGKEVRIDSKYTGRKRRIYF